MKGDFSRFTYDARKRFTRVLKQQGRVDLDADWNEAIEILTRRDRTEAIDTIGRCGVPTHGGGFKVEAAAGGAGLTVSPGRIWVDGILCRQDGDQPVSLTEQPDLPGYTLPDQDGVYLVYLDVWDRHITALEDPDIREVALGGPDTTTRTRTVGQVRLHRIADDGPLDQHDCQPFPADPSTGQITATAAAATPPTNPCAVPEGAGYTGLENRLYRVEIHDDGRADDGTPGARPVTFKWSRDNGSVVLPVADQNGIDGDTVTLQRFGFDDVLTVRVGDWVEVLGDETELNLRPGTLGQIVPDGIDRADMEVRLSQDVSAHAAEGHLKMRRWDHHETDTLALIDGALPLPTGTFELEDGVIIEFQAGGTYHTGDYWVIPARTREGTILWPREGTPPTALALPPLGIDHHYCTLALARRTGGTWTEPRDCRSLFPPLTEVGDGCCCVSVDPGDDIQQALDTVVADGGGCVALCEGVHTVNGPLWIRDGADVTVRGVAAATVVRFQGVDDNGDGGLVVAGGQRVTVEDLFLASETVPALITVRDGTDADVSRQIAFRRLLLLNLARVDGKTGIACGVRLGQAAGVTFDECRIAAEAGVVSLWGDALPDLSALRQGAVSSGAAAGTTAGSVGAAGSGAAGAAGGAAAPDAVTLGFEDLTLGDRYTVGDTFTEGGMTVTGEAFQWSNGEFDENGFARVENAGHAGGSGQDLRVNNINLAFALPAGYAHAQFTFGASGGNVNLKVNGELQNAANFSDMDGRTVAGVQVSVAMDASDSKHGRLRLDADTADISSLAIGGQELWIDDVTFRGPGEPTTPAVLDYGRGVTDLRMRDTAIRFRQLGILAARAEGWQIDRSDIQPYAAEPWANLRELFHAAGTAGGAAAGTNLDAIVAPTHIMLRVAYTSVLAALEDVFESTGELRGFALLAFRWEGCHVRDSVVAGQHGLHAWWWLRGGAAGNRITADQSGSHAFWLYEADWADNGVECGNGLGLSVAGCCRARMTANRLRGTVGIANLPFADAIDGLATQAAAMLRGYGSAGGVDRAVVYGILVDESFRLMGLGPLLDAFQPLVDEVTPVPGVPAAWYLAPSVIESLGSGLQLPMPIVDLAVTHNDVACSQQCVTLNGYLPLGSLNVSANRIHTTTGQAVRIETNPYLANANLVVFLVRLVLDRMAANIAQRQDPPGSLLAGIYGALGAIVETWREGAENLFDLDFRVEGNTIRSLRNAVESNLFELAVLTNHITLQERPLAGPVENTGAIFGVVATADGAALPGSIVRVVGTDRAATTDAKGEYRMAGLAPGSYTLQAVRVGYDAATETVTLGPGEQVEVNFTLEPIGFMVRLARNSFSDSVVAAGGMAAAATNPEIVEVMRALEGSAALEPLGVALREGAYTMPEAYALYLTGANGPLQTAAARSQAADAVSLIGGQTSDPEMQQVAPELNTALRANDQTALNPLLVRFIRALQRYIDSQGIVVKGVGGRIVENEVVVPSDARPETEALGGIQLSVSYAYLAIMAVLTTLLARYLGGKDGAAVQPDPLLGITDTLVDTNEVIGGIGHGISVQGVAGQPDFLSDLRIRNNQVRGMAGAGLFINEFALVVGLDVAGNHISACGRDTGFTRSKGGVLVRTAAVCSVQGNHVVRCGAQLGQSNAYGVDLDTIYGLRFADNEVQANGAASATAEDGGLRLVEVYGTTQLHDNAFAFNEGLGLSWTNSAREGETALLPPFLMSAVNLYLRMNRTVEQLVQEEQASVQGNAFKTVANSDFPVFQLLNLQQVLFSGNNAYAETTGAPLGEIQRTARGVVSNNQSQTNGEVAIAIKKMAGGVVLGNVGNKPIQLEFSTVEKAYNVPAI